MYFGALKPILALFFENIETVLYNSVRTPIILKIMFFRYNFPSRFNEF